MILVTGSAGFVGHHVSLFMASQGHRVLGLDNLNDYYSVDLKAARLVEQGIDVATLKDGEVQWGDLGIGFVRGDILDKSLLDSIFAENGIRLVVHLAAQAGVRYSIQNPELYVQSNINGFFNVLDRCRVFKIEHLVFASSSSVYGYSEDVPFTETQRTDAPISVYAATKKCDEIISYSYAHLFKLKITGLRFFTVYGPWDRPDMAINKFARCIVEGRPIDLYNYGEMERDFTYVGDIARSVYDLMFSNGGDKKEFDLVNVGYGGPVRLEELINLLEKGLGKTAKINRMPIQSGDVKRTWASTDKLKKMTGSSPMVSLEEGIMNFVTWFNQFYNTSKDSHNTKV